MMTSKENKEAFVWIWLPDKTQPIVAGKLTEDNGFIQFNYGKSYLERIGDAISIYEPELPLEAGILPLLDGLHMPNSIRDAAPDAWGRRIIINKLLGQKGKDAETADLGEITYLLESGSDRIGALDFQQSPTEYIPRSVYNASLEELLESAERVDKGIPLTPELDQALFHGSSIGGARPKAMIEEQGTKYIAYPGEQDNKPG
jgi:serine/threonine-protein kinase HipA